MRCAAGLLALCLLVPGAAAAATVTLKQVGPPGSYRPGGQSVDVLGITPGMAPDAARDILAKQYGNVVVTQNNLGLENRGIVVQTQNYVTQMTAQNDTDQAVVWFGTPTTGNGVVEVTRQLELPRRDDRAADAAGPGRADRQIWQARVRRLGHRQRRSATTRLVVSRQHAEPLPALVLPHGAERRPRDPNSPPTRAPIKTGNELTIVGHAAVRDRRPVEGGRHGDHDERCGDQAPNARGGGRADEGGDRRAQEAQAKSDE